MVSICGRKLDFRFWYSTSEAAKGLKSKILWQKVIYMVILHIAALYGVWIIANYVWANWAENPWHVLQVILAQELIQTMGGFGVTGGVHRYWAHRTFKAHPVIEFFMMICFTIAFEESIYRWARDHRVHHKGSETETDPHDSRRGMFFAHMGWILIRKRPEVIESGKQVVMADLDNDWIVQFQHKYYYFLVAIFTIFLPYEIGTRMTGHWQVGLFYFVAYRICILYHRTWTINSLAHFRGKRQYEGDSWPADSKLSAFISMGEGYHNYHHAFPEDYSTSEYALSVNVTRFIIDFFALLGLVWDRNIADRKVVEKAKKTEDWARMKRDPNAIYNSPRAKDTKQKFF